MARSPALNPLQEPFGPKSCYICCNVEEFHELRQCTQCSGGKGAEPFYHCIRKCVENECRTVACTRHPSCWEAHLPYHANARRLHRKIDPLPELVVDTVTYSEPDAAKQRSLHEEDLIARWFTIRFDMQEKSPPRLCVSDRFRQLCNPGMTENRWSSNQYPSFVAFIGDTCVGKSTLLRAMLLMGQVNAAGLKSAAEDADDEEARVASLKAVLAARANGPVTRTASLSHLTDPTSLGVHLYKDVIDDTPERDPRHHALSNRATPILFADCEGFKGGFATTNSERIAREPNKLHKPFQSTTHSQTNSPPMNGGGNGFYPNVSPMRYESNLVSDLPITAASYGRHGKSGAELFYARFLYTISDVVVFVTKNDTTLQTEMQRLLEWAASAVYKAVNHPAQKTLIIVRNMPALHATEFYDETTLKKALFNNLIPLWEGSDVLTEFKKNYDANQPQYENQIHNNRRLFRIFFRKVNVCYIPDKARAPTSEIFAKYRDLRAQIVGASVAAQDSRRTSWMQYNVPALSHILDRAFEHFRTSDEPFDFYTASRNDNPNPLSVSDHMANFLRHVQESFEVDSTCTEIVSHVIAINLITWAFRTFRHVLEPGDMYSRELDHWCRDAITIFSQKYQKCGYRFENGRGCIARRSTHDQHCDEKGNRRPGPFSEVENRHESLLKEIQACFVNLYEDACTRGRLTPSLPTLAESRQLREDVLRKYGYFWKTIRSNKSCFTCLQAVPDHVLSCGHAYCVRCVQEFGKLSRYYEYGWIMDHCVLCGVVWRDGGQLIRLKPKCAGVRILTLDGGGIRGILELSLLEKLAAIIDLPIPMRELFDLIVGTSTGGIIALGLAMNDMPVRNMKDVFMKIAQKAFEHRREGVLITKIDPFKLTSKFLMIMRIWESIYPTTPLRSALQQLFGEDVKLFASSPKTGRQRATRVAVTSTKDCAASRCLITNYNRPSFSGGNDFEREDEDDKEMRVWEAGLATAAAPFYFRSFRKGETHKDYVDGALHANFPVVYALEEMGKIWPGPDGPGVSLDALVTVGTGIQKKEVNIPTALKIGGFEKICTTFHNNLDSDRLWREFENNAASTSALRGKIHRLNAHIKGPYVALDDYTCMPALDDMVAQECNQDAQTGHPSDLSLELYKIADILISSLFFFEPDNNSLVGPYLHDPSSPGEHLLAGSIRCRLAVNSPELKQLVNKIGGFWYTEIRPEDTVPSSNHRHPSPNTHNHHPHHHPHHHHHHHLGSSRSSPILGGTSPPSFGSTTTLASASPSILSNTTTSSSSTPGNYGRIGWRQIPFTDEQRHGIRTQGRRLKVDVLVSTFEPADVLQVIAVAFKGRPPEIKNAISGFPVTFKELKRRALAV